MYTDKRTDCLITWSISLPYFNLRAQKEKKKVVFIFAITLLWFTCNITIPKSHPGISAAVFFSFHFGLQRTSSLMCILMILLALAKFSHAIHLCVILLCFWHIVTSLCSFFRYINNNEDLCNRLYFILYINNSNSWTFISWRNIWCTLCCIQKENKNKPIKRKTTCIHPMIDIIIIISIIIFSLYIIDVCICVQCM